MEGERILRNILNKQNQIQTLQKEVQNYLSPLENFPAKLSESNLLKYHTFSLKLLRCCIQGFQNCKILSSYLLQICKTAIDKLKITFTLLEEAGKSEDDQFDRLFKLLYHILIHLHRLEQGKECFIFAEYILYFSKTQSKPCQSDKDSEKKNIFAKVFEIQWALAAKSTNKNSKISIDESLILRLSAVSFIFNTNFDVLKHGKYLENCLMSCMIDKEKKISLEVIAEINGRILEIMNILMEQMIAYDDDDDDDGLLDEKVLIGYLILLSLKLILVSKWISKDSIEHIIKMTSRQKNPGMWIKLCQATFQVCNAKLQGLKISSCKCSKQLLLAFEDIGNFISEKRLLHKNPKFIVLFDLAKLHISFYEPLCVEALKNLYMFVNATDERVSAVLMNMINEIQKKESSMSSDKLKSSVTYLEGQWHSFLCWSLQVFQSSISKSKLPRNKSCSCNTSQSKASGDIFECCLSLVENTIKSLSFMSKKEMDLHLKEFHWLGIMSYNFGILAQTKASKYLSTKFLQMSMQTFYAWIENSKNNSNDALSKIREVNLAMKQKILVEMLTEIGDINAVMICICDVIQLLFTVKSKSKDTNINEHVENQIDLWIKSKKIIDCKYTDKKDHVEKRLLSKLIKGLNQKDLKFIMEKELNAYKREMSHCTSELEELLDYMIKEFKEKDNLFTSYAIIEYATLKSMKLNFLERCLLCQKAIKLLQDEIINKSNYEIYTKDLLAMSNFYIGFFKLELQLMKTKDCDVRENSKKNAACKLNERKALNCTDFTSSFQNALEIWTQHIQDIIKLNLDHSVEISFKWPTRTMKCLRFLGFIYFLLLHSSNAITAFNLSLFVNENDLFYKDGDNSNTIMSTNYEIIRLLSDLFDFTKAYKFDENSKTYNRIQRIWMDVANTKICNKVGQCLKAESITKDVLADKNISDKTPNSFLIKAEALMEFALCKESCTEDDDYEDHPILAAQQALRILRGLLKLYFQPDFDEKSEEKQFLNLDSYSVSPWIVLDRLLKCLLYIVQRYKMQGSMPESKCHIKEAIVLCKTFSLTQRQTEFLLEEAEIHFISQENEKLQATLKATQALLKCNMKNEQNGITIPDFCDHPVNCSCDLCSDILQMKLMIRYLILTMKSKTFHNENNIDPSLISTVEHIFQCFCTKIEYAVRNYRHIIDITNSRKERKSVKFTDEADGCIQQFNLGDVLREYKLINEKEMSYLFYFDEIIELKLLNYKETFDTSSNIEFKMDLFIDEEKYSKFKRLILHNNRRTISNIYYENALSLLQRSEGIKEVRSRWNVDRYLIKYNNDDKMDDDAKKNEFNDRIDEEENVKTYKTRRTTTSKSRKGRKPKLKRNEAADENTSNEKESTKTKVLQQIEKKVSLADDVEELCYKALSCLVPCLDCLLIKKFYNILSLMSGYKNIENTTYLEQLSFATILKQQMIMRTLKESRKNNRSESDDTTTLQSRVLPTVFHITNNPFAFKNHSQLNILSNSLPQGWRVCSIRMSKTGKNKRLIISRLQADKKPMVLSIPLSNDEDDDDFEDSTMNNLVRDLSSAFQTDPVEELKEVLEESLLTLQTEDVESWWQNRKCLDGKIQKVLDKVEKKWLGYWRGILLGERENSEDQSQLEEIVNQFCHECEVKFNIFIPKDFIELFFDCHLFVDRVQVKKAFQNLLGSKFDDQILELFIEKAEHFDMDFVQIKSQNIGKGRKSRKTQEKQSEKRIRRSPIILILDKEMQKIPWESMTILHGQIISRMPSVIFTQLSLLNTKDVVTNGVNTEDAFYVLNPRNDLQNTQKTFEKWFSKNKGWKGISGKMPSEDEFKNALKNYNMFIYCGHGNGQEFLRGDEVQRIQCKAISFLMGCSSGNLQVKGELEARGMALNYLIAGCPAIVANLWDVTDKDIDRFLVQLLKSWLQENSSTNLLEHISKARYACRLPFLIGASPVVYGLPMILNNK